MSNTGSLSPSLIRTLVPFLVGPLVTYFGVDPNDQGVAVLLTAAIGYGYYVVVRLLETFAGPKWGYVLGVAKVPGYSPQDPPAGPPPGSDHGYAVLGLIGLVLAVAGGLCLLLVLLKVATFSVEVAVLALVVGIVLLVVDGARLRR